MAGAPQNFRSSICSDRGMEADQLFPGEAPPGTISLDVPVAHEQVIEQRLAGEGGREARWAELLAVGSED